MSEVRRMCNVGIDGKVGFVLPDNVWNEVRAAVLRIFSKHEDELVMCNWTLNDTWQEDGNQVVIQYPSENQEWSYWNLAERIEAVAHAKSLDMRLSLFTEETDRDKVEELCGMVARGELEVDDDR